MLLYIYIYIYISIALSLSNISAELFVLARAQRRLSRTPADRARRGVRNLLLLLSLLFVYLLLLLVVLTGGATCLTLLV